MANSHKGFTLLETLVALSILVITVIGVNTIISIAMRQTSSLYYYRLAMLQQSNMLEMLAANNGVADEGMIASWNQQNALVLPNGRGVITGNGADANVEIFWNKDDKLL